MKVYVWRNGLMMTGKAWEIQQKLRQAGKEFHFVKDWTDTVYKSFPHPE